VGLRSNYPALQLREAELPKRKKDYAVARIHLESSAWRCADAETQEAAAYFRLPLHVHTVNYESLIRDFDNTVSACLDFLGMDWDDGVRDYVETAKRSKQIITPSYDKVTQALYTGASGRWQRYRQHVEPVLPVLLPWAERMGYAKQPRFRERCLSVITTIAAFGGRG